MLHGRKRPVARPTWGRATWFGGLDWSSHTEASVAIETSAPRKTSILVSGILGKPVWVSTDETTLAMVGRWRKAVLVHVQLFIQSFGQFGQADPVSA